MWIRITFYLFFSHLGNGKKSRGVGDITHLHWKYTSQSSSLRTETFYITCASSCRPLSAPCWWWPVWQHPADGQCVNSHQVPLPAASKCPILLCIWAELSERTDGKSRLPLAPNSLLIHRVHNPLLCWGGSCSGADSRLTYSTPWVQHMGLSLW